MSPHPSSEGTDSLTTREGEGGGAEPKLSWWWSRDDERFYGPNASRADAIMDAWADDPDQGAYVCQATQGEWRTDIIDKDVLAEAFDEANEEQSDPDGDGPSCLLNDAAWAALTVRLNQLVRAAIRDQGLTAWGFSRQKPSEWIDIGAMWRAAEAPPAEISVTAADTSSPTDPPREASEPNPTGPTS